jgi:hypothetical protein
MILTIINKSPIQTIGLCFFSLVPVYTTTCAYVNIVKPTTACSVAAACGVAATAYWIRQPDKTLYGIEKLNPVSFIPIGDSTENNTPKEIVLKTLAQQQINTSITINGKKYIVERGISPLIQLHTNPITLYSGGYSNDGRPYAYCGYTAIKAGLVPGACITFDFPTDTRSGFNFGQAEDIHCVKTMCQEIVAKAPHARIILHGACKGANNNLRFLAETAEQNYQAPFLPNITAVIAESPTISVSKALQNTPLSFITLAIMRVLFPNYNHRAKTILESKKFPSIPVLIASLPHDSISTLHDVRELHSHLNNMTHAIQWFISQETSIRHGQIGKATDYQKAVKDFLQQACTLIA